MSFFYWKVKGNGGLTLSKSRSCIMYAVSSPGLEEAFMNHIISTIEDAGYEFHYLSAMLDYRDIKKTFAKGEIQTNIWVVLDPVAIPLMEEICTSFNSDYIFYIKNKNSRVVAEKLPNGVEVMDSFDDMLSWFQQQSIMTEDQMEQFLKGSETMEAEELAEGSSAQELEPPQVEHTQFISSDGSLTELEEEELHAAVKNITEFQMKHRNSRIEKQIVQINQVDEQPDKSQAVQYEENPFYLRSRTLQKQVFAKQKWEKHRLIGVWSPINRMGVTSFVINFAFFLAQNRIYTAVLEGLTNQHAMKDWLQRYTSIPPNWVSYAQAIQSNINNPMDAAWIYRDVVFLPLDHDDLQYEWHSLSLETYMTTTNIIDITIVDMPTGEMAKYTRDSLHYLDELWIVGDDAFQESLAWKSYIHKVMKDTGVPARLLFNKHYPFSQSKRLSKEMDLPLLTEIPSLHEEIMRNYYETSPLIFKQEVYEKLEGPFIEIAKHLFGNDFSLRDQTDKRGNHSLTEKLLHPFRTIFQPLKN